VIEEGRGWSSRVDAIDRMICKGKVLGVPTRKDERSMLLGAQGGDEHAREQLIVRNSPFAMKVAGKYRGQGMEIDDIFQCALCGMNQAIDKYDTSKHKVRFITYAVWWIRQSILLGLNSSGSLLMIPINRQTAIRKIRKMAKDGNCPDAATVAKKCGVSRYVAEGLIDVANIPMSLDTRMMSHGSKTTLGETLGHTENDDVADASEAEWAVSLIESDHKMTAREKDVVIGRIFHDRTLEEIAVDYGVCRERIRQVQKEAMVRVTRIAKEYDQKCGFTQNDRRKMLSMGG
jgi:RNA polymerase primary sigma factor